MDLPSFVVSHPLKPNPTIVLRVGSSKTSLCTWKISGIHSQWVSEAYTVDILRGQPIKLIQVVSTSEWMEWPCFCLNHSLGFLHSLRSIKDWMLQKASMTKLKQMFKFLFEKWVFWCSDSSRTWTFWSP